MAGPYYTLEDLNYPYGPPTPDSRAGRIPGEITNSPSVMEEVGAFAQPLLEYGPLPAQGLTWLGSELTGIPSMIRGGSKIGESLYNEDPMGVAAGLGESMLGMIPAAAATKPGLNALKSAYSSYPRAIGTTGALTLPQTVEATAKARKAAKQSEEAAKPDDYASMREAVQGDPELEALFSQWREQNTKASAPVKGVNKESADKIRSEASQKASDLFKSLTEKVEVKRRANLPFRDRYPGAAEAIMFGAGTLAAGLPFANAVKGRLAEALIQNPGLNRLAQRLEKAFEDGETPDKIAALQRQLQRRVDAYEKRHSFKSQALDFGKNWGLSSMLMFEGAGLPEQIDALAFNPGHPVREQARQELTSGDYYKNRIPASVLSGLATAGGGRHIGEAITPGGPPRRLEQARELIDRGSPESIAALERIAAYQKAAKGVKPRTPKKPADSPLKDAADKVQGMNGPKTYAQATQKQKDDAFNMLVQEVSASGRGKVTTTASIPEITKKIRSETGLPITEKRVRETLKMLGEHLGTTGSLRGSSAKRTAQTLGIGGAFAAPAAYSLDEDY